jgi:hypothetical protein
MCRLSPPAISQAPSLAHTILLCQLHSFAIQLWTAPYAALLEANCLPPPPPTPAPRLRACMQVVATIHQPNSLITDHFDDWALLAQGRLLYSGLWSGAVPYFDAAGYACPMYRCAAAGCVWV